MIKYHWLFYSSSNQVGDFSEHKPDLTEVISSQCVLPRQCFVARNTVIERTPCDMSVSGRAGLCYGVCSSLVLWRPSACLTIKHSRTEAHPGDAAWHGRVPLWRARWALLGVWSIHQSPKSDTFLCLTFWPLLDMIVLELPTVWLTLCKSPSFSSQMSKENNNHVASCCLLTYYKQKVSKQVKCYIISVLPGYE